MSIVRDRPIWPRGDRVSAPRGSLAVGKRPCGAPTAARRSPPTRRPVWRAAPGSLGPTSLSRRRRLGHDRVRLRDTRRAAQDLGRVTWPFMGRESPVRASFRLTSRGGTRPENLSDEEYGELDVWGNASPVRPARARPRGRPVWSYRRGHRAGRDGEVGPPGRVRVEAMEAVRGVRAPPTGAQGGPFDPIRQEDGSCSTTLVTWETRVRSFLGRLTRG